MASLGVISLMRRPLAGLTRMRMMRLGSLTRLDIAPGSPRIPRVSRSALPRLIGRPLSGRIRRTVLRRRHGLISLGLSPPPVVGSGFGTGRWLGCLRLRRPDGSVSILFQRFRLSLRFRHFRTCLAGESPFNNGFGIIFDTAHMIFGNNVITR